MECQNQVSFERKNHTTWVIYHTTQVIYLWSKVVCLFCFYLWDPPNRDASDRILGLVGKLSRRRGASSWLHGIWTCGAKVLEYWMICSLKIKLNRNWKLQRNWNVPLVLLERSWWAWRNGIYLDSECGRYWFLSDFCCWVWRFWPAFRFSWALALLLHIFSLLLHVQLL